ncbi:MAG: GTP pyrophosphokinase family protein [Lachnospiraceae bacterium]|nr:GTP pyrophosphokinase family protein [Lachnospiraceae bacterium]MBQ4068929.1 GTP pyrophosphokinase family protein [Lachnospiraceae bacterium]
MEIQLWREKLSPYQLAVDELLVKFRFLALEHKEAGLYSPIENVKGRVKKISSILEKMQKKKIAFEDIDEKIEDIAGIRIICQFVEDIEKVVELIKSRDDMEIKSEKNYIDNMKESGYRSYHMIVYYNVQTMTGNKKIKVEIQIRTMAMNFWATIEHSLQYKYRQNMPDTVRERLRSASEAIINLDNEMSLIRTEIIDSQNYFTLKANVVAEILNTIQNLYKIANKREIVKIQDEFYKIYMSSDLEQLHRFSKELDVIAEGYRAQGIE